MEKPSPEQIADDFRKIREARGAREPMQVAVAFNYAQGVRLLLKRGYTLKGIAEAIGYKDHTSVADLRDGAAVPDHMAGEALWGLLKNAYPAAFPDSLPPEKKRALVEMGLLEPAHVTGGKPTIPMRKR